MSGSVIRLVPQPTAELPLEGLYLAERLRDRRAAGRTFVYTNFVASLDGRVSVSHAEGERAAGVPGALANPRDWRLYQELAVQADVVITSGRYLRDLAAGHAGPLLTYLDDPGSADLRIWRKDAGLPERPAVAVVSRGLDFDHGAARSLSDRVFAICAAGADPGVVRRLEAADLAVIGGTSRAGVLGAELAAGLADAGLQVAFSAAGPQLAHLLIEGGVLDALYVTYVTRLLGGTSYATLDEGSLLSEPRTARPRSLYLDDNGARGAAQLFASFDLVPGLST